MGSTLRIIVTGLVGQYPVGGVAWDYLHYVVGLSRLGHEVYYHEDTWSWPYHPLRREFVDDGRYSADFLHQFFRRFAPELTNRWHYQHLHETSFGMARAEFDAVARSADLFLNVSGACALPDELSANCRKIFLDTDPGYNQIVLAERSEWSEQVDRWCATVASHDLHFTYAENIYGPDCAVPTAGMTWRTTRTPVLLDLWEPVARRLPPNDAPWTTVLTWQAFKGELTHAGRTHGSKGEEFEKLIELPRQVAVRLKVAVGGKDAPLERLVRCGWEVVDAPTATLTPTSYQQFIADSRAELSAAKQVYVALRTGWFSCRSACYLAAGRPVVVQDTGFSSVLPVGDGILAFSTPDEAIAAIEEVSARYQYHARVARDLAEEWFDSGKVLNDLLAQSAN